MICYSKKLKRVIKHLDMLQLPEKTKLMVRGSYAKQAKKDLKSMKLVHIEKQDVRQPTDLQLELMANFEYGFYVCQEKKKFKYLDNIARITQVFLPDVGKNYRNIENSDFYRYPSFIDEYIFKTPEQKLFVIMIMSFKKQEQLKRYNEW